MYLEESTQVAAKSLPARLSGAVSSLDSAWAQSIGGTNLITFFQIVEEKAGVRHVEDQLLHLLGQVVQQVSVLDVPAQSDTWVASLPFS